MGRGALLTVMHPLSRPWLPGFCALGETSSSRTGRAQSSSARTIYPGGSRKGRAATARNRARTTICLQRPRVWSTFTVRETYLSLIQGTLPDMTLDRRMHCRVIRDCIPLDATLSSPQGTLVAGLTLTIWSTSTSVAESACSRLTLEGRVFRQAPLLSSLLICEYWLSNLCG